MPSAPKLIACHECDLLQRKIPLPSGGAAACHRCGAILYRSGDGDWGHEAALALLIAAAIVYVVANAFPILGIEFRGEHKSTTLFGAVLALWNQDMPIVAGLVLFTAILAPGLEIFGMIFLLAAFRLGRAARALPPMLRLILAARPWSMVEVFMLGVLVTVVKLSHLAAIVPGVSLWAYGALMILLAAATSCFNAHALWAGLPLRR